MASMPIIDYEARAQRLHSRLFGDSAVSAHNKALLRRFLVGYDVSPARRCIFLEKAWTLLKHFPKLEDALRDRDGINELFSGLRSRYSPASYATYLNVARRLLTWLNDGDKPKCLSDIKKQRHASQRSQLKAEDMISWKEGLTLAQATTSTQLAALLLTQLDCGFRPSEVMDLDYGDVRIEAGLAIIHVSDGKTGARTVVAHRCVPALMKWLAGHPTQAAGDPLWVSEQSLRRNAQGTLTLKRYSYAAVQRRLRTLAQRLSFRKKLSFYPLRHSSCRLDKIANLPPDLAAERHGHSVKHFVGTYGRLSVDDLVNRYNSHYGRNPAGQEPERIEHTECRSCHMILPQGAQWCHQCGTPTQARSGASPALTGVPGGADEREVLSLKEELRRAQERELALRREQLDLLEQMQEIKRAVLEQRSEFQRVQVTRVDEGDSPANGHGLARFPSD